MQVLLTENMLLAMTIPRCVLDVLLSCVVRLFTLVPWQWQWIVPVSWTLLTSEVRPSLLETTVLRGLNSVLNRLLPVLK